MIYDLLIAVTTDNLKDGGKKHVDFFTVKGKYVSAGEQGHQVERKEVLRSKRDRCCHGSKEKTSLGAQDAFRSLLLVQQERQADWLMLTHKEKKTFCRWEGLESTPKSASTTPHRLVS